MGACTGKEGVAFEGQPEHGCVPAPSAQSSVSRCNSDDNVPSQPEGLRRKGSKRERLRKFARHCNSFDLMTVMARKSLEDIGDDIERSTTASSTVSSDEDGTSSSDYDAGESFEFESDPDFQSDEACTIRTPPVMTMATMATRRGTQEEPECELDGMLEGAEGEPEGEPSDDEIGATATDSSLSSTSLPRGYSDRPDFSGSWMCSRVEGDWEAFLKEAGVSWTLRKAISSMGFGVGRQSQDITQTKDQISVRNVVNSFPPREALCVYRTDGQAEEVLDLEGHLTRSMTYWEGVALITEQRSVATSQSLPKARRVMQGDEMCTVRVSASGLEVKRFYTRR